MQRGRLYKYFSDRKWAEFIFCVSRFLTDALRERFNAVACVEISNIGAFCDRVTAAIPSNAKFPGPPGRQRIGQRVQYYRESGDC